LPTYDCGLDDGGADVLGAAVLDDGAADVLGGVLEGGADDDPGVDGGVDAAAEELDGAPTPVPRPDTAEVQAAAGITATAARPTASKRVRYTGAPPAGGRRLRNLPEPGAESG
jgi:hypothetical protein